MARSLSAVVPALALLAACGSPAAQYFHVSVVPMPAPQGMNCGTPAATDTYSSVADSVDWTLYPGPSNNYLLEGAVEGDLLVGTANGSTYTFKGVIQDVGKMPQFSETLTSTVVLNMSGDGFSGTVTQELACSSMGNSNCSGPNSANTADFDCSAHTTVEGVNVGTVQSQVADTSSGDGTLSIP